MSDGNHVLYVEVGVNDFFAVATAMAEWLKVRQK